MNIFFLHWDPSKCAEYHVDKHVVKMILETCQLLCCVWHCVDPQHIIFKPSYKKTHMNHPCAKWARDSKDNYFWLCQLGIELCKEYTYRYHKTHKCQSILDDLLSNIPPLKNDLTLPPLCMPNEYKIPESFIQSYRKYYIHGKKKLHSWKKREIPFFISSYSSA